MGVFRMPWVFDLAQDQRVHNGAIYKTDCWFHRLGLSRYAEEGSELIFLLIDRFCPRRLH